MNRTLMAVGAHADDIELNVGGTLLKYRERGYQVVYVMSTNNMSGCWTRKKADGTYEVTTPPYYELMPQRKLEAAASAQALGTAPIRLDHPQRHFRRADGTLCELRYGSDRPDRVVPPDVPSILTAHEDKPAVQRLADLILEHKPEAILTHGPAQSDMEHIGTALLVIRSYQQAVAAGHDGMLLMWRDGTTFWGEFNCRWDTFVDISAYWEKKVKIIALHACQIANPCRPDFPPRQRALAWGTACGCQYAEVFTIAARAKPAVQYTDFTQEIAAHA